MLSAPALQCARGPVEVRSGYPQLRMPARRHLQQGAPGSNLDQLASIPCD
jgi:hypothetical protein